MQPSFSMKILSINNFTTKLLSTIVKIIYSENATKFREIFTSLLTTVHTVKSKVKISQNFVAFSEYMKFTDIIQIRKIIRIYKPT